MSRWRGPDFGAICPDNIWVLFLCCPQFVQIGWNSLCNSKIRLKQACLCITPHNIEVPYLSQPLTSLSTTNAWHHKWPETNIFVWICWPGTLSKWRDFTWMASGKSQKFSPKMSRWVSGSFTYIWGSFLIWLSRHYGKSSKFFRYAKWGDWYIL